MIYHFCTLFDKNYLFRGLALHKSLLKNCPEFKLWILCMDDITYEILIKMQLDKVELIRLSEFEDHELIKTKISRTQVEYCWTCTPSLLLYILERTNKLVRFYLYFYV